MQFSFRHEALGGRALFAKKVRGRKQLFKNAYSPYSTILSSKLEIIVFTLQLFEKTCSLRDFTLNTLSKSGDREKLTKHDLRFLYTRSRKGLLTSLNRKIPEKAGDQGSSKPDSLGKPKESGRQVPKEARVFWNLPIPLKGSSRRKA